jgi:hypothetical protein
MNITKEPRANWKIISVLIFLALIVGTGILSYVKYSSQIITSIYQPLEIDFTDRGEIKNWKIYADKEYKFEIKYPDKIISISKEGNRTFLTHSIDYEHSDACDFIGNKPALEKLTDFNVNFEILNKSFRETIIEKESDYFVTEYLEDDKFKTNPGFIDEITIGSLQGYKITMGVEGCGEYRYYFPLDSKNTLIVSRAFITEFKPIITDYQEYLKLPGIIPPEREEKLFNLILSTFKFKGN